MTERTKRYITDEYRNFFDDVDSDKWIEVYSYGYLPVGNTTSKLSEKLKMKNIDLKDYAKYSDINVSMTGYACGAEGVSENTAWSEIKNHFGID